MLPMDAIRRKHSSWFCSNSSFLLVNFFGNFDFPENQHCTFDDSHWVQVHNWCLTASLSSRSVLMGGAGAPKEVGIVLLEGCSDPLSIVFNVKNKKCIAEEQKINANDKRKKNGQSH